MATCTCGAAHGGWSSSFTPTHQSWCRANFPNDQSDQNGEYDQSDQNGEYWQTPYAIPSRAFPGTLQPNLGTLEESVREIVRSVELYGSRTDVLLKEMGDEMLEQKGKLDRILRMLAEQQADKIVNHLADLYPGDDILHDAAMSDCANAFYPPATPYGVREACLRFFDTVLDAHIKDQPEHLFPWQDVIDTVAAALGVRSEEIAALAARIGWTG